jgi:hypothetical protein
LLAAVGVVVVVVVVAGSFARGPLGQARHEWEVDREAQFS